MSPFPAEFLDFFDPGHKLHALRYGAALNVPVRHTAETYGSSAIQ
jgi:hypothetical protein